VAALLRGAGVRVHLDDRDTQQPGFKYADWEMRGVPLRIELGQRDIEGSQCVLVRRDTRAKENVPLGGLAARVGEVLPALQRDLLERARRFLAENTRRVSSYDEFKQVMADRRGFLVAGWCGSADCEARVKQETRATIRVIPLDGPSPSGPCVRCGQPATAEVYFAQAY
jgi:prolyl-tRNA synthetase